MSRTGPRRRRYDVTAGAFVAVMSLAAAALAQTPGAGAGSTAPSDAQRGRYQIRVMERVLEQAVQHGTQVVALQFRTLAPSSVLFAGPTQARGFALEGYGVFFDVQVPTLRRSLTWTFRTLNRDGLALGDALTALRQHVQSLGDSGARDALELALRSLEVQVGPLPAARQGDPRAAQVGAGREVAAPAEPVVTPADVYATQIRDELVNVMLDYSGSLSIAADDWLTVASMGAGPAPSPAAASAGSGAAGLMLRIRGRDLAALRARDITRVEARTRIETVEF